MNHIPCPWTPMAEEKEDQSFLPLRTDRTWNTEAKWSWKIRAASFYITWDPIKNHKAHFLKIKTEEQTIFCSASTLSGMELSSVELCSKIMAMLLQTPEEPYCFLLSSCKKDLLSNISPVIFFCLVGWKPHFRELKELKNLMDSKFKPSVTRNQLWIPKIWIYNTNTDTAFSKEMVDCDPKLLLQ